MSDFGHPMNFKQLLASHGRIQIPIIQRDYAQGRPGEEEVREDFLLALQVALQKPADDASIPFNLDFIYGSIEGQTPTRFLPLDGQQRLTTLFLLHWYLAWIDDAWPVFGSLFRDGDKSRFSYAVRASSNEFFDALVHFKPEISAGDVATLSDLIVDQPWYFRSWRLDPTIQSVLSMLDAIHARFASSVGLFERLTDDIRPAITFQLLDLDNFGLSDDLYIKMNARGKPLTQFETFKARYERELKAQAMRKTFLVAGRQLTVAEYVSWRIDNAWADLFWASREQSTNQYDAAIMNIFRAVALATRNPDDAGYLDDSSILRQIGRPAGYSDFHTRCWLDELFTDALIRLLDAWSASGGVLRHLLPNAQYFDEQKYFQRIVSPSKPISFSEAVQLTGYILFLESFGADFSASEFQAWMRVVFNLSENTEYNRPEDLQRSVRGLRALLPYARNILDHLADPESEIGGFSKQQIDEERLKARLLAANPSWSSLLENAETHGYFQGQVEFLLDWCGVISDQENIPIGEWTRDAHAEHHNRFSTYLAKAMCMFGPDGLNELPDELWRRALLTFGDYLLPKNRNYSLLVDRASEPDSWKRLLKGDKEYSRERRGLLQMLLDRLDEKGNVPGQLIGVIDSANGLEPWIEPLVRSPAVFAYCQAKCLRWDDNGQIYLLRKTQMNGMHAELFSFELYKRLVSDRTAYAPLQIERYTDVSGSDLEPYFNVSHPGPANPFRMSIQHRNDRYSLTITALPDSPSSSLSSALRDFGFSSIKLGAVTDVDRSELEGLLVKLAATLSKIDKE